MKAVNVALQRRANDFDFSIFIQTDKGDYKSFVFSRELLQHLRDSIDKKLTSPTEQLVGAS